MLIQRPVVGLVAGLQAPRETIMGHSGASHEYFNSSAQYKTNILKNAGVSMVGHPSKLGSVMRQLLHVSPAANLDSLVSDVLHWC